MVNTVDPLMGFLSLLIMVMGIQLIRGKWLFLIAGYNTMTKEEKKRYNGPYLGKLVGSYLIFVSLVCLLHKILPVNLLITLLILSSIIVVILGNTSKRIGS
ncbi:DUF3784 domain-containing protein [Enterococcus gilvus]|uniref:DUF3784 domain-containing protein n=1 Tax=Enterococcus gilvus TaxID=160453 RepID=UPI001C8C72AD|nr:DUF3784 domain-containing protein [Enterococcus gilvus]MBX8938811.1 DUF3784 domain-containing protein [Enterococcus gilvus]